MSKERPILFSGPMVRAILSGSKTQTRRVVKPQDVVEGPTESDPAPYLHGIQCPGLCDYGCDAHPCPYGAPGDQLWVRETFNSDWCDRVIYRADGGSAREAGYASEPKWKPSIFMRRSESRLTLEVTSVRVERLHDISNEDAIAEGIERPVVDGRSLGWENYLWHGHGAAPKKYRDAWLWQYSTYGADRVDGPRLSYSSLWSSINGPASWEANPWVWVVGFKRAD